MSGFFFPVGLCTLRATHHVIAEPSNASWILAFSYRELSTAHGFEKIAATNDAQQLSLGTAVGMPISAEIAPAAPAPVGTVRIGAEMACGVDLAAAPPCRYHAREWG